MAITNTRPYFNQPSGKSVMNHECAGSVMVNDSEWELARIQLHLKLKVSFTCSSLNP